MHEQGMHKVMIVLENRITVSQGTSFPANRRSAVHRTPHYQQEPGEKGIVEWQGVNRDHPECAGPENESGCRLSLQQPANRHFFL